ncbi:MAG: glycosyltransferase family 4 protein [Candidatus Eremiobacteraeota bacterium]|nr:glycosyltransferase family 4 protein [Candidatus Eremiobacteraeota bacterium]
MSIGMKLYVHELVQRLPRIAPDLEFTVVSNATFLLARDNVRCITLSDAAADNGGLAEQFWLPNVLRRSAPALVHFMSMYAPRQWHLPHVYTIHDLTHLRYPQYFSWKVPWYYRAVVKPVARSAAFVVTDAYATIGDLVEFLAVDAQRIRVVPLAAKPEFSLDDAMRAQRAEVARVRHGLFRPYFLYAGNHRPHKNLAVLIAAWKRLNADCDLVITEDGAVPEATTVAGVAADSRRIVLTGRVSEEQLVGLYAGCVAAVQPSLYEGFGLSVLEAMAAGAAVIVARTPALVEVAGQAALTFSAQDAGALAEAMKDLLDDERSRDLLRAEGRARAREFSWDATARQTAGIYREALARA